MSMKSEKYERLIDDVEHSDGGDTAKVVVNSGLQDIDLNTISDPSSEGTTDEFKYGESEIMIDVDYTSAKGTEAAAPPPSSSSSLSSKKNGMDESKQMNQDDKEREEKEELSESKKRKKKENDEAELLMSLARGMSMNAKKISFERILAESKPERRMIGLGVFLTFIGATTNLITPILLSAIVTAVSMDSDNNGINKHDLDGPMRLLCNISPINRCRTAKALLSTSIIFLIILGLFNAMIAFGKWLALSIAGCSVVSRLRKRLFIHLISLETAFFDDNQSGELTNRIMLDTTFLQTACTTQIAQCLQALVTALLISFYLFYLSWSLTLTVLLLVPITVIAAKTYGRFYRKQSKINQDLLAIASSIATETFQLIRTVKAFSKEDGQSALFLSAIGDTFRQGVLMGLATAIWMAFFAIISNIGIGVILWMGATQVLNGHLSAGSLTSYCIFVVQLAGQFGTLLNVYGNVMKALGASERIFTLLDRRTLILPYWGHPTNQHTTTVEVSNDNGDTKHLISMPVSDELLDRLEKENFPGENDVCVRMKSQMDPNGDLSELKDSQKQSSEMLRSLSISLARLPSLSHGSSVSSSVNHSDYAGINSLSGLETTTMTRMNDDNNNKNTIENGTLELRDVCFSYPSRADVKVLENITLIVPQGSVVALVGESGGGKSTIARLFQRFYDVDSGTVLIDGKDIRDYDLREIHRQVSSVSQEPDLFSCSILDNLVFGLSVEQRRQLTESDIIQVCKQANCHGFIESFPEQYLTVVGEKGIRLSGGQKQRIAIARALLTRPKCLLLDEATSALDAESEHLVQQALDRAMESRTVLVIAHRLSTVKQADCVLVIDKGTVVEKGTHDELVQLGGVYKSLVQRQLS